MPREPDCAVEVVYALPERVIAASARVRPGATVAQVLDQVRFAELAPDADIGNAPVGIFGRVVSRDTPVHDGDRIEIYRPLVADPQHARRQRSRRKVASGA
jgi:putative ubiquitin-RnfH superfamily antitoxin RatB of RatAB toxin-antitoxin module